MKFQDYPVNDKGHLLFGGCDTVALAKKYGTPVYVMDEAVLRENMSACVKAMQDNFPKFRVYYASKAFSAGAVLQIARSEGMCLDVVSSGELHVALHAGFPAECINMHGNVKTLADLRYAVQEGVGIVADSQSELDDLEAVCAELGKKARVYVRVTPGIEAHTHDYIRTGMPDCKFALGIDNGMAMQAIEQIARSEYMTFAGIHCHIGSQIFEDEPFRQAAVTMATFALTVKERIGEMPGEINMGGGFGVSYTQADRPLPAEHYIRMIREGLVEVLGEDLPVISIEPGRRIVCEAGITLYSVCTIKDVPGVRKFVSVDGGMTDNPRVALYQAVYTPVIANRPNAQPEETVSIAGRCCESGDMLVYDVEMPKAQKGEILAIFSTGAYNYAMASNYNKLPIPPVVLVSNGRDALIVRGQSLEDMVRFDETPEWL